MLTEELIKLLDSLQQKHLSNTRHSPDQNDMDCGRIAEAENRAVNSSNDVEATCDCDVLP
jgi:hypothetical protein